MFKIFNNFLIDLFNSAISGLTEKMGNAMANWMDAAFFIEKQNWGSVLTAERITSAFWIMYGIAAGILVLKFIQKGFMVYILWRDGDADNDPGSMLLGSVLALAVTIAFPALYQIFADAVQYIGKQILSVFEEANYLDGEAPGDPLATASILLDGGFASLIAAIAFAITWVILLFKMMMRSVEMLIYRLGFPLAAIGLVNSDGGSFKGYIQLLFKQAVYMLTQTLLAAVGIAVSATSIIGGVVILICAVKAPKFLSQFFPALGGGGGASGIVYAATTVARLARGGI